MEAMRSVPALTARLGASPTLAAAKFSVAGAARQHLVDRAASRGRCRPRRALRRALRRRGGGLGRWTGRAGFGVMKHTDRCRGRRFPHGASRRLARPKRTGPARTGQGGRAATGPARPSAATCWRCGDLCWIAGADGTVTRLLLHPIALYFLLFAPAPRRHIKRYLFRAIGPQRRLDRRLSAAARLRLDRARPRVLPARAPGPVHGLEVEGNEPIDAELASGRGAFLLGAHVGSFEALGRVQAPQRTRATCAWRC
jgi:hypothetical protein